jgi:hypothetical protein
VEFPAGSILRANPDAVRNDLVISDQFTFVIRFRAANDFTNNIFKASLLGSQGPKDRTLVKLIQTKGKMLFRSERWKQLTDTTLPWDKAQWGVVFMEWDAKSGTISLAASQTGNEMTLSKPAKKKTPEKKTLISYEVGFPMIHEKRSLRSPIRVGELLVFSGTLSESERVTVQDTFSW